MRGQKPAQFKIYGSVLFLALLSFVFYRFYIYGNSKETPVLNSSVASEKALGEQSAKFQRQSADISLSSDKKSAYKKTEESFEGSSHATQSLTEIKEGISQQLGTRKVIVLDPRSFLRKEAYGSSSAFSESYKEALDIELHSKQQEIQVAFDPPLENYVRVLLVGGEGKSFVSDVQVNQKKQRPSSDEPVELFEKDWQVIEEGGAGSMKSLNIRASAKGKSRLKIYIQFKREV